MTDYDPMIDRQTLRGIDGVEAARFAAAKPRRRELAGLDERALRDLGLSRDSL